MQVICLQENLKTALFLVNRIISQKAQLPILSNVLIQAQKKTLSLLSTDLELGLKIEVPAKIEHEGEITIPAKTLLDLVSILPPEKIEIKTEGTTLTLKTKNQKATFLGIPAVEFPQFTDKKGDFILGIGGSILKTNIKNVVYASSIDESRPVLNGVLFKNAGGEYIFVATDGYRLSLKKMGKKNKQETMAPFVVPGRVLKELCFLIEKEGGENAPVNIFMASQQNQIRFEVGGGILVGRLIEGEFPDYEKIIPQNVNTTLVVEKEDFLNSVKIASVFARDSANIVKIAIKKDGLFISANAPQIGDNQSFVEARVSGEENEIAFNSRFLLEFLANLEEKEIVFEMTGPLNPGVFKIQNDNSFLHLIMPVRIQEEK